MKMAIDRGGTNLRVLAMISPPLPENMAHDKALC